MSREDLVDGTRIINTSALNLVFHTAGNDLIALIRALELAAWY